MRIGIDLTALLAEATGVDVSLLELVRHLARVDRDNAYVLFANAEDRERFGHPPANFRVVTASRRPRAARLLFQQILLPAAATALRLDVVHSPSFILPLVRGRSRHLLTVHDMTSFSLPDCHEPLRRSAPYLRAVRLSIRRADLVSVPSRHVRADVVARMPEVAPERIRVVPWGVGEQYVPLPPAEARRAVAHLRLPPAYVLFVGTVEPRKNLPTLLEAFRALVDDGAAEHLVVAGRHGWGRDEVVRRVHADGLAGRVHLLGYVAQRDLPALYAAARAFVYPSIEEGFGFPPLEAMACGTPTVASLGSSLGENLSGAAELVPPRSAAAIADALRRVLRDEARRAELRAAGLERARRFSWSATAEAFRACYADLAAGHGPGDRPGSAT